MAEERRRERTLGDTPSVEDQVKAAVGEGGNDSVWIREDGAVCFGDECIVIKPGDGDALDMEIKPDKCGSEAGGVILDHILKTAGKGVNIRIPPADVTSS